MAWRGRGFNQRERWGLENHLPGSGGFRQPKIILHFLDGILDLINGHFEPGDKPGAESAAQYIRGVGCEFGRMIDRPYQPDQADGDNQESNETTPTGTPNESPHNHFSFGTGNNPPSTLYAEIIKTKLFGKLPLV